MCVDVCVLCVWVWFIPVYVHMYACMPVWYVCSCMHVCNYLHMIVGANASRSKKRPQALLAPALHILIPGHVGHGTVSV